MSSSEPDSTFLWGVATSSHQIEGYNDKNDWWAWEAEGHIEGGARSGAATDHWTRFRDDLRLARDLGLNTYRFSIEWSRLQPEEDRWSPNAFEWYEALVAECEKLGLLPMATLHHFTSPHWFARKGGFTHRDSPRHFAEYARRVAENLGSRIPLWCTLNEPGVLVSGTYLGKFMPPAVYSPEMAALANENLLRSHVAAYDILHREISHRKGPWKDHPMRVGIAHNLLDFLPDRFFHPIERLLVMLLHRFHNRAWLDAVTGRPQRFGIPGFVPSPRPVVEALGRKTIDFVGVNYYTKAYVRWRPKNAAPQSPADFPLGLTFARRKEPASDVEWAIHPKGFGKMLRFASRYGLPIYVTENGIADRDDRCRSEYLLEHLQEIDLARSQGIDIRGYYHWSLLDNFEWIKGFGPRFGLFHVDYETMERTPRASADLFKKLVAAHQRNQFAEARTWHSR
jgi:beta-glucosidase